MKIAIFYTTNNTSTRKSCEILSDRINEDVKLIEIGNAKSECILKYDFLILAGSAISGKVQGSLKTYISRNLKTLREKPIGLIINCEEDIDRFNTTFGEELVKSSYNISNFGYELNPNEGNYIERRRTNKLIDNYTKNGESLPELNMNEIDKFASDINAMIEKRVD